MIVGAVRRGRLIVALEIGSPDGRRRRVEAMLDTGFTGDLLLPADLVRSFGLPPLGEIVAITADGRRQVFVTYEGRASWPSEPPGRVEVVATGNQPLCGSRLLRGQHVAFDMIEGGAIEITPLAD